MKRKPTVNPIEKTSDMSEISLGKIDTAHLTMIFQRGTDVPGVFQKCLFSLPDKHLFSTSCLEHVLEIINNCPLNDEAAKRNFNDMLR